MANFDASQLANLQLKVDAMWGDERDRQVYGTDIDTIAALLGRQTAKVEPVKGTSDKDAVVDVKFIRTNIDETSPVTAECSPVGEEPESVSKQYKLDITRQAKTFKVRQEQVFRNNIFEPDDAVIKGLLGQNKVLDDYINRTIINTATTFSGENRLPVGYLEGFDVAAANTYIADEMWNENLFMDFQIVSKFNKFGDTVLVHGKNYLKLSEQWKFDSLDNDKKNKYAKLQVFNHIHDPIAFHELGISNNSYMIDAGAVAFASKNYFPTITDISGKAQGAKELTGDKWGFAFPSTIPGVFHDVTVTRTCEAGSYGEEFAYTFQMRTICGFFNAPEIKLGDTGVLEFVKGSRV